MTMVKKAIETLANVSISLQFFLWCITFICPVLNSYYKIFSNGYILAIYILSIVLTLIILLSKALYGFVYPKPVFVFSLEKSIDAIFVVIVVATFIAFNWMTEKAVQIDSYNPDYGGLFGGVISGISTLLLVKFTLSMQRRVEIQTRKRSANALYTIFSMIEDQLSVLNPTSPEKVIYDASYDYYYKILASEIHFVDRINSFICEGKTEDLKVLMKNRVEYWQYLHSYDFNIFEAMLNIQFFSNGFSEEYPFKDKNRKSIDEFISKYWSIIENWIYNYILKNGTCNYTEVIRMFIPWISEKFPHVPEIERTASYATFKICINFDKYSKRMKMVWNEISINDTNSNVIS